MTNENRSRDQDRMISARESFSGRLLTDPQFEEAMAITSIIERKIVKSGTFKDKLGDYAYAMARTEKMDVVRAETTIRDLFKARTGQTMNQMREEIAGREEKLPAEARDKAYRNASQIGQMIREYNKMSFYRAYAFQAQMLGAEYGITDAAAKTLMRESFKEKEGRELIDWGKELDEQYYRPQIEAEKKEREKTSRTSDSSERSAGEAPKVDQGTRHAAHQMSAGVRRTEPRLTR